MLDDVRLALRTFRTRPGLSFVAILTVTIGLGTNLSLFGILNGLLFRPMPGIERADRVVIIHGVEEGSPGVAVWRDLVDYRAESRAFDGLAALKTIDMNIETGGEAERLQGSLASDDYFRVFDVKPALGRFFLPNEQDIPVAVLSHDFWTTHFGSDRRVLNQDVRINGRPFRIVGVAPPRFRGPMMSASPAVFVPFRMLPLFMRDGARLLENRGWGGIWIAGRLATGQTIASAQSSLDAIAHRLEREYPNTNRDRAVHVVSLTEGVLDPQTRATVLKMGRISMLVLNLLLLLVCANLALLTLMRSAGRAREFAVRKALGSGTARLVRQLTIESSMTAIAGAIGGLLLARWAARLVSALPFGMLIDPTIDWRMAAFAGGLTVFTILLSALVPAVVTSRTDIQALLANATSRVVSRSRTATVLVMIQIALSASMLFASGLLVRSVMKLRSEGYGFDPANVVVATVNPSQQGREDDAHVQGYYDEVLARLRARPEVVAAGAASMMPLSGDRDAMTMRREGDDESKSGFIVTTQVVRDGYFEALKMPIVRGRALEDTDRMGRPFVLIVNESLAQKFWPGQDPIGKRMRPDPQFPWFSVVGVVRDSTLENVRDRRLPGVFAPHRQIPVSEMGGALNLFVRGRVPAEELARVVGETVRSVDRQVPVVGLAPLEDRIAGSLMHEQLLRWIVFGTGAVSSFLAMVGLYAVLAFLVARRRREIGIRMALGASAAGVRRLILGRALLLLAPSLLVGLSLGLVLGRLLAPFLYRVPAFDSPTAIAVAMSVTLLGLTATWWPARTAATVDPAEVLRVE